MSLDPQKNIRPVKSQHETSAADESHALRRTVSKTHSHFLVPPDKLDKVTRRVIAPYAQIERKGVKEDEVKDAKYLDISRFNVFLEDTIDLDSLLYETAGVLKTVTRSSGVFVYIVNKTKNEIVMMPKNTKNPERHEVNIPIEEGKVVAAHVAHTREFLVIDDVERDHRFSEGLKWVDAKAALCMPVVKPDGECYAVLELFRTFSEPYDNNAVYSAVTSAWWAGAAVHQARARLALQKTGHLNTELRSLLQKYFSDLASFDTMVTDMLAVVKTFLGATRSSLYTIDWEGQHGGLLVADMWDDGWTTEKTNAPRKRLKINLSLEQTPAGLAARTATSLNVNDVYKDPRFNKEIDPTTGTIVRSTLVAPIMGKNCVIGVVQVINKSTAQPFTEEDEEIFKVFVGYCSLIVHFTNMQSKKMYHTAGLMLAGFCHDIDHPGFNNNFLTLTKHPLAHMYRSSILEYHHYFLAKKVIEDKKILSKLTETDQHRIIEEIKYNILCTDLALYFQLRAQLAPLVADHSFDWTDVAHRKMLKGIMMTTCDLSGCCKPFGVSKGIAEAVYAEFYNQGDKERELGYTPLSMMDRRRSSNQPAEQIQFLSVVVLPCAALLHAILPNTKQLADNTRKTQEAWHEEIEMRGQRLWKQDDSVPVVRGGPVPVVRGGLGGSVTKDDI